LIRFPHNVDMHQRRVAGFDRSKNSAALIVAAMMRSAALRELAVPE
jgi:hypothetical protein